MIDSIKKILFTGSLKDDYLSNLILDFSTAIDENQLELYSYSHSNDQDHISNVEQIDEGEETDEEVGDDFESLYKGEISKSGTPILPSKRARKTPEKIQVLKEDLEELSQPSQPNVEASADEQTEDQTDVSLEEVSESENQETEVIAEDSETSNS